MALCGDVVDGVMAELNLAQAYDRSSAKFQNNITVERHHSVEADFVTSWGFLQVRLYIIFRALNVELFIIMSDSAAHPS